MGIFIFHWPIFKIPWQFPDLEKISNFPDFSSLLATLIYLWSSPYFTAIKNTKTNTNGLSVCTCHVLRDLQCHSGGGRWVWCRATSAVFCSLWHCCQGNAPLSHTCKKIRNNTFWQFLKLNLLKKKTIEELEPECQTIYCHLYICPFKLHVLGL